MPLFELRTYERHELSKAKRNLIKGAALAVLAILANCIWVGLFERVIGGEQRWRRALVLFFPAVGALFCYSAMIFSLGLRMLVEDWEARRLTSYGRVQFGSTLPPLSAVLSLLPLASILGLLACAAFFLAVAISLII